MRSSEEYFYPGSLIVEKLKLGSMNRKKLAET